MKWIDVARVLSLPLIPLYWLPVRARNLLFDLGIFPAKKVNAKIISVGNITVGGAGKTPMTIYIVKTLQALNKKVAVLSRGYGRETEGYVFVSDGKELQAGVNEAGDEMFQTASECRCPAAVCENRVEGAVKLIEAFHPDVIVLDDAFQHRWIARDVDVVLFDQRFLTRTNRLRKLLLPTGSMRESFSMLRRADCIVINRKFSAKEDALSRISKHIVGKPLFNAYYRAVGFIDVRNGRMYEPKDFQGQVSLAVCGIAFPHSFFNALDSVGIAHENRLVFVDHKRYSIEEVQRIRKEFYAKNCYSVVTTQKDAVKLTQFKQELDDIDIYYLKIELVIEEESAFTDYLKSKID
jgi:tetraacyldisaccharide 4'-kinase